MKICAAQIKPFKGDIEKNISFHLEMIERAISFRADAIFFPELSLTGYEPDLAKKLATNQDDPRLNVFREICNRKQIVIGAGLPTQAESGMHISMIIFQPGSATQTYSKQHLHADELPFFTEGKKQVFIQTGNLNITPAICYESLLYEHAENAAAQGANFYIASVAKSIGGLQRAYAHYPKIARKFSIPVLMTNAIGFCDNFESAGKSAAWNRDGILLAELGQREEGLVTFDTATGKAETWKKEDRLFF